MGYLRSLAWGATLAATGATPRELRRLRRAQWLTPEESAVAQRRAVEGLLGHAYRTVPYYRDLLRDVVGTDATRLDAGVLARLPLLTKEVIRTHAGALVSTAGDGRGRYTNTSGGSTGEPVVLVQDQRFRDCSRAVAMLFDQWTGYRVGFPMAKIWGSERDLFVGRETVKTRVVRFLRNEHWFNAFRMTPSQVEEYVARINRTRPQFVLAYVESIFDIARFIEREGLDVWSPRAVMTSAGPLDDHVRAVVERVFRAPVFNRYGSREVGDIACDCSSHRGQHVCSPYHVVEVLRPDGTTAEAGEVGEIVVTLLTNFSMPLIRYRIGDTAKWASGPCGCGRPWPRLESVTGGSATSSSALTGVAFTASTSRTSSIFFRGCQSSRWSRKP
jgi:phenylacetate-CoA ligase